MTSPQAELRDRCAHRDGGHTPVPWSEIEDSVHARFERIAAARPGDCAIEAPGERFTYRELNRRANGVAAALRDRIAGPQQPVAMLFPHGAGPIVSLLGILKAGHVYLGLDPADPPLRIRQILEHSGARFLLCNRATLDKARQAARGQDLLLLEDLPPAAHDEPGASMPPESFASIYYTSGSTGKPKGVLYTHRARLVTALRNSNGIRISRHDRLALLYPARYAGAVNNTFGALLNGACLLPFDYAAEGAASLARFLSSERITIYHSVPAMFREIAAYAQPGLRFDAMRLVMLSSDSVYPSDLAAFARLFPPGCLFANSWGVSEAPLFRPCFFDHRSAPEGGLAAIGIPLAAPEEEDEVLLLDESGGEAAPGETGEIVVRSRFFAAGYWRNDEQTRALFRPDPCSASHQRYHTGDLGRRNADGSVVHLGRKDFQVQIGGERVEVAEIEAVLGERAGIRAAVVTAQTSETGQTRLVAYVECPGEFPMESDLREYVAERLPRQMTPDRFVFCRSLSLTEAGKVDRKSLPSPSRERPRLRTPFEAPATDLERGIAAFFGEVLELDGAGVRDSFFELGGKSLGAMRVLASIHDRYGIRVEMTEFFAAPTVVSLAAAVELARSGVGGEQEWNALLGEVESQAEGGGVE